jgi:Ribonuclease HI
MLYLCKKEEISFDINPRLHNTIAGGKIKIRDLLTEDIFREYRHKLKQFNLFYLEQITTLDGQFLLNWFSICKRNPLPSGIIRTPNFKWHMWYCHVKDYVTRHANTYELKNEFKQNVATTLRGVILKQPNINHPKVSKWVYFYDQNSQSNIFGIIKTTDFDEQMAVIQHTIIDEETTEDDLVLKDCTTCHLNNKRNRPNTCLIQVHYSHLYYIQERYNSNEDIQRRPIRKRIFRGLQINDIQLHLSFMQYFYYQRLNNYINFPQNIHHHTDTTNIITRYLEPSVDRNHLINYQNIFNQLTNLTFFTDGSIINISKEQSNMTFGFYNAETTSTFTSSCSNWPSSTHAELMGILSAIITSPQQSNITIYTDSNAAVTQFNSLNNGRIKLTPRQIFKLNSNTSIWNILIEIINENDLNVQLIKIPAHSGIMYNELIDKEVTKAHKDNYKNLVISNKFLNNLFSCAKME